MDEELLSGDAEEYEEEKLPMHIGVDEWCFHNSMMVGRMTLEGMVTLAAEMGAEGVGFDYFMMSREARKSPERLRDIIAKSGLELVFGFGIPFALPDVVFQALEIRKNEMFELAHEFGAKILRVCGGLIVPNMVHKPFHLTINRNREIDDVARRLKQFTYDASLEGLTVALENHSDYTIEEMLRIIHYIDSDKFRITLDTGNAVYLDEDPVETAKMLAPYTVYTHIKDMKRSGPMLMSVPLGQGEVDIPEIVNALKNNYYTGLYSIECNLPLWQVDQEEAALRESIKFLQGLAD
ncbi:MAG: sugar phosphate isomerase/epimerase family protein [bacterium]